MNNGIIWSVDLFWNCFTWLSVDKFNQAIYTMLILGNLGISRNGVRINTYLTEVFEDMGLVTSGTDDIFYWKDKEQLENYSGYRMASERESLDIAPEEVAQAILQVLREQFAIDEEGLISETARLFGYANVRDNVFASMKRGIEYALKNNIIQLDGGRYKLIINN